MLESVYAGATQQQQHVGAAAEAGVSLVGENIDCSENGDNSEYNGLDEQQQRQLNVALATKFVAKATMSVQIYT